jgi:hypothetical protein
MELKYVLEYNSMMCYGWVSAKATQYNLDLKLYPE